MNLSRTALLTLAAGSALSLLFTGCSEVRQPSAPQQDALQTSHLKTASDQDRIPGSYIVVFKEGYDNDELIAGDMSRAHGFSLKHVYGHALHGFAADIPASRLDALARDPRIDYIEEDQ